ncbi:hypothetical protein ABW20_dc0106183 [Dactylellina cionopaga]|nr:hypothetical protein ABW20_dc0106183 [Dactylellina cionopaga]
MLDDKLIELLAFGLYLNDYDTDGSQLTIGSIDVAKYEGNLVTFDSNETTSIMIDAFLYDIGDGDPKLLAAGSRVNIEFSVGFLYLPNGSLGAIVEDIGAYQDDNFGGYYLTDCSYRYSKKVLHYNFQGLNITVPASQWIIPAIQINGYQATLKDGTTPACLVLVDSIGNYKLAVDNKYDAVFGAPFARAIYLVIDYSNKQISFAPAKLNITNTDIRSLGADGVSPFAMIHPTPNSDAGGGSGSSGSKTPVGAIAGGVIGGVAAIGLAIGAVFLRRRQIRKIPTEDPPGPPMEYNGQYDAPPNPPVYNRQYTNEVPGTSVSELPSRKLLDQPVELPSVQY